MTNQRNKHAARLYIQQRRTPSHDPLPGALPLLQAPYRVSCTSPRSYTPASSAALTRRKEIPGEALTKMAGLHWEATLARAFADISLPPKEAPAAACIFGINKRCLASCRA
jgi:hypothetical protein